MEPPAQAKLSRSWSAWCEVYRVCSEVEAHVRDSRVHRWCDTGLSGCDVSCGWTEVRAWDAVRGSCADARVGGQSCLCDRCGVSPKCDESVPRSLRDR